MKSPQSLCGLNACVHNSQMDVNYMVCFQKITTRLVALYPYILFLLTGDKIRDNRNIVSQCPEKQLHNQLMYNYPPNLWFCIAMHT